MSRNIPNVYIEEFVAEAEQVHQGSSMLRHTCRIKRGVVGTTVHFPLMGRTRAVPKTHRGRVIPANVPWHRPDCTLSDWHVAELTDVFEDIKTNVDERANLARSFMMAIGRQEDQFVIDALENAATSGQGTVSEVSVGASFAPRASNVGPSRPSGLIAAGLERMLTNEVPENGDFFALLPAAWYPAFVADEVNINKFYGETDLERRGLKGRKLMSHGVELIFMGDRRASASNVSNVGDGYGTDTGLVAGGASFSGWMWEKNSLGLAYGKDPSLDVDWLPDYTSWLTCMAFSAGATAIDNLGIVKLNGPTDANTLMVNT